MINESNPANSLDVQYYKSGGSAITARLGFLRAGVNTWAGFRSMSAGMTYRNDWSGLSSGCYPTNGLLNTSGGATYQTSAADPC
ncbi:hypothetical protein ACFU3J_34205 [Streptomyces sp. NPDC057411]|uniref:hypothetical protein n=1 Tax=unclassified Streptomyces TaxID=2593676 RepID=UPI003638118A